MNPSIPDNPFVGLRPFESEESLLFFGRQEQTMDLMERLHVHHFVAVVGSSGCGKSSLIRAGLIPRLKAGYLVNDLDRWKVIMMKPGDNPIYNLVAAFLQATADPAANVQVQTDQVQEIISKVNEEGSDVLLELLRPLWEQQRTNVFLLVDQFEELFRFGEQEQNVVKRDQSADLVNLILELSENPNIPFYCVITMRSDFIGDCSRFYGLPEALNKSQYLVPRLPRAQLRTVIEGPVRLYGASVQPALTARLLNDLEVTEDMLPLLQHCLMRIWDFHHQAGISGPLDLKDYEQVGGIEKALSNHADEALINMSDQDCALAKKIFQALTGVDANGRKIRRPARLNDLAEITGASKEQLLAVIERFIEGKRSFLVIGDPLDAGGPMIDISHESLIRQWTKLNGWVDEEAEASRSYLLLVESYLLHKEGKKDLLTGIELQLSLVWYHNFNPRQPWAIRYSPLFTESVAYLLESQQQSERGEKRARSQRKKKMALLVGVPAFVVLMLLILGGDYVKDKKEERIKDAYRMVTVALYYDLDINPTATLRIVQAALDKVKDTLIESVAERIYRNNLFYKTIFKPADVTISVISADGFWVITSDNNHQLRLWHRNRLTLTQVRTWNQFNGRINCVAFSGNGTTILTGSLDSIVRLWTPDGACKVYQAQGDIITSVAFSPDELAFLSRSQDGVARIWKLNGDFHELNQSFVICDAFFPLKDSIITGSTDGILRVWDLNGNLRSSFGHMGRIMSVAFSPDGEKIIAGSWDMTAQVFVLKDRSIEATLGYNTPLNMVRFSPSGQQAFVSGYSGNVRIWKSTYVLNGSNGWDIKWLDQGEMKNNMSMVRSLGLSLNSDTVITASKDGGVRLWDCHKIQLLNGTEQQTPTTLNEFLTHGAIDSFSVKEIDSMTNVKKQENPNH
jgi:WD40 repeat protein